MKRIFLLILVLFQVLLASGQRVGLVLSGGGAKGLSHIGVIKVLEDNNIPVDYVCGTSMGAVIASMYAMGISPEDMYSIVLSPEFGQWCRGEQEEKFANSFYTEEVSPKMLQAALRNNKGKLGFVLPSSLLTPYPLDLAMLEVYASPAVAAGYRFENLMVPFFCISSDVKNKRKVVHTGGDLGSAVRASMTYPFIFKPITMDSTVLFDGGFYDNFPWKELDRLYGPDFIIGSKCVGGDTHLDDEDIVGQITNMIVSPTDFDIPPEKGTVIEEKYPYGVMEFEKAGEIIKIGYEAARKCLPEILEKTERRRSRKELDSMRLVFRQKCKGVLFAPQIEFEGNLNEDQKRFVTRTIMGDSCCTFDFNTLKRGYYKVVSSGVLNTFYPSYVPVMDSLLALKIKASAVSPVEIAIGGNISSAHLNQGYLGIGYTHFGKSIWKLGLEGNIGTFYKGASMKWRHNSVSVSFMHYGAEAVVQKFRYPVQDVSNGEIYLKGTANTALDREGNISLHGNILLGKSTFNYLPDNVFRTFQSKDRTELAVLSASVAVEKYSLDTPLYPTEGTALRVGLKWNRMRESYIPGAVSAGYYSRLPFSNAGHSSLRFRATAVSHIRLGDRFTLGYNIEVAAQKPVGLEGYIPSLLGMPAFAPFPHASTLLLKGYRADTYAGFGISPVICVAKTLFLQCNISYFQPYREIYEIQGGGYSYGKKFPKGAFLGNAALVWHLPVGPVSFSASWYQRGEHHKWYPQLNIGFLLYKKKILDD